jgi:hypothetical protein
LFAVCTNKAAGRACKPTLLLITRVISGMMVFLFYGNSAYFR